MKRTGTPGPGAFFNFHTMPKRCVETVCVFSVSRRGSPQYFYFFPD
jgi:hypothetical protein